MKKKGEYLFVLLAGFFSAFAYAQTEGGDLAKTLAPLQKLWHSDSSVIWQLLAVGIITTACYYLSRALIRFIDKALLRNPEHQNSATQDPTALSGFARGGLLAVSFPLITAIALVLAQYFYWAFLRVWFNVTLGYLAVLETAVPIFVTLAVIRIALFTLRQTFSPSGILASFERFISIGIWSIAILYLSGIGAHIVTFLKGISLPLGDRPFSLWSLITSVFTIIVSLIFALWCANVLEKKIHGYSNVDANTRSLLGRIARSLLVVITTLLSLVFIGVDISSISLIGGALGVGIGFGLQKIASNYISGFIILLDRSVRPGDAVSIGNEVEGWVSKITTRYTIVNDLRGVEYIVPNERFINDIVRNRTFSNSRVLVNQSIQVDYDTDVEKAMSLMVASALACPCTLNHPEPVTNLISFDDSGMTLELAYWVPKPEDSFKATRSTVNLKILELFREHGINIPFPQRVIRYHQEAPKRHETD